MSYDGGIVPCQERISGEPRSIRRASALHTLVGIFGFHYDRVPPMIFHLSGISPRADQWCALNFAGGNQGSAAIRPSTMMVWKLNSPEKVDSSMDALSPESPASKEGNHFRKRTGQKNFAGAVSSTDRLRRLQKRTDEV